MKHNTKRRNGVQSNTESNATRMVGLRLPNDEFVKIEEMAKEEDRSIASFARICLRLGMKQLQKQTTDES